MMQAPITVLYSLYRSPRLIMAWPMMPFTGTYNPVWENAERAEAQLALERKVAVAFQTLVPQTGDTAVPCRSANCAHSGAILR